jgi:hypothetical protein
MTRKTALLALVLMIDTSVRAQTAPQQEKPKPRPGVIVDTPSSGRITDAPAPQQPQQPTGNLAGQIVERFEAVGNTSVASDTIRIYLGVSPGDAYERHDPHLPRRQPR